MGGECGGGATATDCAACPVRSLVHYKQSHCSVRPANREWGRVPRESLCCPGPFRSSFQHTLAAIKQKEVADELRTFIACSSAWRCFSKNFRETGSHGDPIDDDRFYVAHIVTWWTTTEQKNTNHIELGVCLLLDSTTEYDSSIKFVRFVMLHKCILGSSAKINQHAQEIEFHTSTSLRASKHANKGKTTTAAYTETNTSRLHPILIERWRVHLLNNVEQQTYFYHSKHTILNFWTKCCGVLTLFDNIDVPWSFYLHHSHHLSFSQKLIWLRK